MRMGALLTDPIVMLRQSSFISLGVEHQPFIYRSNWRFCEDCDFSGLASGSGIPTLLSTWCWLRKSWNTPHVVLEIQPGE